AGEVQSGLLTVKVYERLHELLGLSAAQRISLEIFSPPQAPSSFDKITAVIEELARSGRNGRAPELPTLGWPGQRPGRPRMGRRTTATGRAPGAPFRHFRIDREQKNAPAAVLSPWRAGPAVPQLPHNH